MGRCLTWRGKKAPTTPRTRRLAARRFIFPFPSLDGYGQLNPPAADATAQIRAKGGRLDIGSKRWEGEN